MTKPELVLSNTTTFFSGNIEAVFKKAKKTGYRFVEILPYRWTKPGDILSLEKKYGITVAGIHLPQWWNFSIRQIFAASPGVEKFLNLLWFFYLGKGIDSPSFAIAKSLAAIGRPPYLVFHANLLSELGEKFPQLDKEFHILIENVITYAKEEPPFIWNSSEIQKELDNRRVSAGLVFDPAHLLSSIENLNTGDLLEIYKQIRPEVVHIGYPGILPHALPNTRQQELLQAMLKIYQPRYITIETNPAVNLKEAKTLLKNILSSVE